MDKHYLDKEMDEILKEKNRKKQSSADTETLIYYLCLLLPVVFFCFFAPTNLCATDYGVKMEDGFWWTCRRCRTSQWTDRTDWQGNYYCIYCYTKAGDE